MRVILKFPVVVLSEWAGRVPDCDWWAGRKSTESGGDW